MRDYKKEREREKLISRRYVAKLRHTTADQLDALLKTKDLTFGAWVRVKLSEEQKKKNAFSKFIRW